MTTTLNAELWILVQGFSSELTSQTWLSLSLILGTLETWKLKKAALMHCQESNWVINHVPPQQKDMLAHVLSSPERHKLTLRAREALFLWGVPVQT